MKAAVENHFQHRSQASIEKQVKRQQLDPLLFIPPGAVSLNLTA